MSPVGTGPVPSLALWPDLLVVFLGSFVLLVWVNIIIPGGEDGW